MLHKVFIVDDDEISIFVLESFLEAEGFAEEYRGFQNAEEALNELLKSIDSNNLPEVIFLDLNMPVLSGWDFLEALQPHEEKLLGKCNIYILTSSVNPSEIKKAENYSLVQSYLHKPLSEEALEEVKKQTSNLRRA